MFQETVVISIQSIFVDRDVEEIIQHLHTDFHSL